MIKLKNEKLGPFAEMAALFVDIKTIYGMFTRVNIRQGPYKAESVPAEICLMRIREPGRTVYLTPWCDYQPDQPTWVVDSDFIPTKVISWELSKQ